MAALYEDVETFFADFFSKFGRQVARHPVTFALVPLIVCSLLALGCVTSTHDTDVISVYAPRGSQADIDRDVIGQQFPPQINHNPFYSHQLLDVGLFSQVILTKKSTTSNRSTDILDQEHLLEILKIHYLVTNVTLTSDNEGHKFDEVCAMRGPDCAVDGINVVVQLLEAGRCSNGSVTSLPPETISSAKQDEVSGCWSADAVRLKYNLAQDTHHHKRLSDAWLRSFIHCMTSLHSHLLNIEFMTSRSLDQELTSSVRSESAFIALVLFIMFVYVNFVFTGGNWVSTRIPIAWAAVLSSLLAVGGASGLLSLCGLTSVDSCRVLTFALLGKTL